MDLKLIEQRLTRYRNASPQNENAMRDSLGEHKSMALLKENEALAKWIWCLDTTICTQTRYRHAFSLLKAGKYYDGWCELEHVENDIDSLEYHLNGADQKRFGVEDIKDRVKKLQGLFPYKIFMSPEILIKEVKCSICGSIILPRKQCGHQIGEIYGGDYCFRIVSEMEPLGISFVKNPVQKYSVPFLPDEQTNKLVDHYNYDLLKYLMSKLSSPFDEWRYEISEKTLPHSNFAAHGRNDKCPCGSGKKYKKCCLKCGGVRQKHYDFILGIQCKCNKDDKEKQFF